MTTGELSEEVERIMRNTANTVRIGMIASQLALIDLPALEKFVALVPATGDEPYAKLKMALFFAKQWQLRFGAPNVRDTSAT